MQTSNDSAEVLGKYGQEHLKRIATKAAPEIAQIILDSNIELDAGEGYLLLENTGIDKVSTLAAELGAISLGCLLGSPTPASRLNPRVAWHVQPEYSNDEDVSKTFSQTSEEASMHTDTQYSPSPEKYFGLFCLRADVLGQGTSRIIKGSTLLRTLYDKHGQDILDTLGQPFPFLVPPVFANNLEGKVEVTWAPIADVDKIRYRRDTLQRALQLPGVSITSQQAEALICLENTLKDLPKTEIHLKAGDALFVNNHRVLHGRTAFTDPKRSMLRVRMDQA